MRWPELFDESNSVEDFIKDCLSKQGWDYVHGPHLDRQLADVLLDADARTALERLNPSIAARPELSDELIYKLRAVLVSVRSDGLVRANEEFAAWLKGERSMPFGPKNEHVPIRLVLETKDVIHPGPPGRLALSTTSSRRRARVKIHGSARTCPKSRKLLWQRISEQGWSVKEATEAAGVSVRTGHKWLARYKAEGEAGLVDRTSRPNTTPVQTPHDRVAAIAGLRRLRMTGAQIAEALTMPLSTVGEVLRRVGLGQLRSLEPEEPPNRYERRHPGELIHIDVKKLARIKRPGHRVHGDRSKRNPGAGWEFVHVCVDDATRVAYVEVLPDEKAPTAVGFLRRALAFYRSLGVEVQRVMTDNGGAYVSAIHAVACRLLGIRHIRTRPYRPRTNGKAERFIRTMLNECLYAAIYQNSDQRRVALAAWLERYNERRPHGSLGRQAPMTRLRQSLNNVLGAHS